MEEQTKKRGFFAALHTLSAGDKVWLCLLLTFPVNLLLVLLAKAFPATVERVYANGFRPAVMGAVSRVTGVLPFSLAEVLILAAVLCGLLLHILAVIAIVRTVRRKESVLRRLADWLVRILAVFFCGVLVFNLTYGLCYYRENTGVKICKYHIAYTETDIVNIAAYMTNDLNNVRRKAGLDDREPCSFTLTVKELSDACRQAYASLAEDYPVYGGDYGSPKPVMLSKPWTYTYVMGMYFPFTGEANYNTNIPSVELPHTVLHEMAHQRGIAAEDEANFAAFLAGRYCEDKRVGYSALFESWCYVMNSLRRADEGMYHAVLDLACEGVKADMQHTEVFWESYDSPLAAFSDDVNRVYLESNGVEFGTASYSLSVQYILDYYVNTYLMDHIVFNE